MGRTMNFIQQIAKTFKVYDYFAMVYLMFLAKRYSIKFLILKEGKYKKLVFRRKHQEIRLAYKHIAYGIDLIRFFDYYFNAVEPQKENDILVVDYSYAREHILKNSGLSFYFTSLPESCETTNIYIERTLLSEGCCVFDIGAYCGASTHAFSRVVGKKGVVYAFEPDPLNYGALLRNIQTHGLNNVMPIQKGIWSKKTTLEFLIEGNMGSSANLLLNRPGQTKMIEVTSIIDVVHDYDITRLDFIKMDIEGAEVEVLLSALSVLKRFNPKLIIEPHKVDGVNTIDKVCDLLIEADYKFEIIAQGELDLPLIFGFPKNI